MINSNIYLSQSEQMIQPMLLDVLLSVVNSCECMFPILVYFINCYTYVVDMDTMVLHSEMRCHQCCQIGQCF